MSITKEQLEEMQRQLQEQQKQLARDQQHHIARVQAFEAESAKQPGEAEASQTVFIGTVGGIKEFNLQDDWRYWCEKKECISFLSLMVSQTIRRWRYS